VWPLKTANRALNGIPVYWIVNLVERQVEVHSSPTADGYGVVRVYKPVEDVPVILDGVEAARIGVADILP
jgi:Uma2 family endonuclease